MAEQQQQPAAPEPSFREQVAAAEAPTPATSAEPTPSTPTEALPDYAPGEDPAVKEQEKIEKVVPLNALHEERMRRKEAQQQNALLQQQIVLAGQRLDAIQEAIARQAPAAPPIPDPQQDPFGFTVEGIKHVAGSLEQMKQERAQDRQREQAQALNNHIISSAQLQDAQFTAQQPDAPEAIQFLKARKYAEYTAAGVPEQDAIRRVLADEWSLVTACLQRGENPSERAYAMAKAVGYAPKPIAVAAEAKAKMQKEGQGASLPSANSGTGGGKLSLDALLKMDGKQFLETTKDPAKWRKMMGG